MSLTIVFSIFSCKIIILNWTHTHFYCIWNIFRNFWSLKCKQRTKIASSPSSSSSSLDCQSYQSNTIAIIVVSSYRNLVHYNFTISIIHSPRARPFILLLILYLPRSLFHSCLLDSGIFFASLICSFFNSFKTTLSAQSSARRAWTWWNRLYENAI